MSVGTSHVLPIAQSHRQVIVSLHQSHCLRWDAL